MKKLKTLLAIGLFFCTVQTFGQDVPDQLHSMFDEIITNFETITSGNSIKQGKNTLSVINENKLVLRTEHKKKVKNLTFLKKYCPENKHKWVAANSLTIDTVNKYEEYVTETLQSMQELSEKKSKE